MAAKNNKTSTYLHETLIFIEHTLSNATYLKLHNRDKYYPYLLRYLSRQPEALRKTEMKRLNQVFGVGIRVN